MNVSVGKCQLVAPGTDIECQVSLTQIDGGQAVAGTRERGDGLGDDRGSGRVLLDREDQGAAGGVVRRPVGVSEGQA